MATKNDDAHNGPEVRLPGADYRAVLAMTTAVASGDHQALAALMPKDPGQGTSMLLAAATVVLALVSDPRLDGISTELARLRAATMLNESGDGLL